MLAFFGQPKFALNATNYLPVGYELFIREKRGDQWILPTDFNAISVEQFRHLLLNVINSFPSTIQLLSFSLEQQQFIDPAFAKMIADIQHATSINLFTELTEREDPSVTTRQLLKAAREFHRHDLLVCVDDVGTGHNTPELVMKLDEYIDEYKFAFQNLRPFNNVYEIESQVKFWYDLSFKQHKMLAIEGIERAEELAFIQTYYPSNIIQGYYTGHPALLATD